MTSLTALQVGKYFAKLLTHWLVFNKWKVNYKLLIKSSKLIKNKYNKFKNLHGFILI